MPFVQPPRLGDGHPVLLRRVQRHVATEARPFQHRREGLVDLDAVLKQQSPGRSRFLPPAFRQIDVAPARVAVLHVPLALAVPQQNERVQRLFAVLGEAVRGTDRIAGQAAVQVKVGGVLLWLLRL